MKFFSKVVIFLISLVIGSVESLRYQRSLVFARKLAEKLLAMGRPVNLSHAKEYEAEGEYHLVDEKLGIYDSALAVLKGAEIPSILVEVGLIVDQQEEKIITTPESRERFAAVLIEAIKETNIQQW